MSEPVSSAAPAKRGYTPSRETLASINTTRLWMLRRIQLAPCAVTSFTGASEPALSKANAWRHLYALTVLGYIMPLGDELHCITPAGANHVYSKTPTALPDRICNAAMRELYQPKELDYRGRA